MAKGGGRGREARAPTNTKVAKGSPKMKPAPASVTEKQSGQRKQLKRRDSDEQADRYISRKFSHIDSGRLKTLRNAQGLSVHAFVKAELKRKRCSQGRLSSSFAVELYKSFKLEAGVWEDLPEPPKAQVNKDLYEVVSLCHDENRFVRDVKPLCNYLQTCAELDETNFHSLLKASLPGPLLDAANSAKIQVAILSYMVRFATHIKLPNYWDVVHMQLDASLKENFEATLAEGVRMKNFLKTKRHVLSLFVDADVVNKLVEADGDYSKSGAEIRSVMAARFQTGAAMFKNQWLGCANDMYYQEVRDQLSGLEHNDFAEKECEGFFKILADRSSGLKRLGEGKKLKWRYSFELFGIELTPMDVDDPRDAAYHALRNRLKTIAVNRRQIEPLWWESLLVEQGSVKCCPETFEVPQAWIDKLLPAREYCADIVRDCRTLDEVIKKVEKAAATLTNLDRNFECDIIYLRHHAAALLRAQSEQAILETIPTDGAAADFGATLASIRDLSKSLAVTALGEAFVSEVDGIYDTMQQISSGQPPHDKDLPHLSPLTKAVLQRAAVFCKYELARAEKKARGPHAPSVVYGAEAVQLRFRALQNLETKSEHFDLSELRPVKQFKWLLEDAQKVIFSKWLKSAVPMHANFVPALTAKANDESEGAIVPAAAGMPASSSSGSSSSSAVPAPRKKLKSSGASDASSKQLLLAKFFPR